MTSPEAARLASEEADDYPVLPENWDALQLFLRCATQWRYAGMAGVRTGLDYPSVETVMRMTGTRNKRETFWQLQLIEDEALKALAELRD
ncbi:DUF1799 domain-containing protein [Marinobacter sp.]|uniref:DUF1799 domain-containing protein n=1 Tax=Marinobacter sp. TaxID=50741 RepID=UPI0034A42215